MPITGGLTQARDEILEVARANMPVDVSVVVWEDDLQDVAPDVIAADVNVQHLDGDQASFPCEPGRRRWESEGVVRVRIRVPESAGGLTKLDELATLMRDAFRGASTPGGVWFQSVVVREVPPKDRKSQADVTARFRYQEIG